MKVTCHYAKSTATPGTCDELEWSLLIHVRILRLPHVSFQFYMQNVNRYVLIYLQIFVQLAILISEHKMSYNVILLLFCVVQVSGNMHDICYNINEDFIFKMFKGNDNIQLL